MKRIMKSMMLSCDKATTLMEKGLDVGLSFAERLKLRFHTSMCDGCTNYQKQTRLIDDVLRKHLQPVGNDKFPRYAVAPEFKTQIIKKIESMQQ